MNKISIVVLGGGTAGWMSAAALSNSLNSNLYSITLVESEEIGTVGVGEATVPHLRYFNEMLGINETEFIRKTNATYKLGIDFVDWGSVGTSYLHPFGIYGKPKNDVSFHHYWKKAQNLGVASSLGDYSVGVTAALSNKFSYPSSDKQQLASKYSYAFHIDASLYAKFLREYSEEKGVVRQEGKVQSVKIDSSSGNVSSLLLSDSRTIFGDYFIDCSGFKGLLIEGALNTGYENWDHWLPCDRAVAVPSESVEDPTPYTTATAKEFGWQWRIPLQSRCGNGLVYSSQYASDELAERTLLSGVKGKALADLNFLKFQTGRRRKTWNKNCVAVGLSSGFLEPLESTSIYLIQIAITKFLEFFPDEPDSTLLSDLFNSEMHDEYIKVRDFLILHYTTTTRDDSEFWRYLRSMAIPETLSRKIQLFKDHGVVEQYAKGMFLEPSWVAVYLGQQMQPSHYHPLVDKLSKSELREYMIEVKDEVDKSVALMNYHQDFLQENALSIDPELKEWPPAAMSLYEVFS